MNKLNKNILQTCLFGAVIFGMSVWCLFKPADSYSDSERRPLAQFPTLSVNSIISGDFMQDFESYTVDQLPMRDSLRGLKARFSLTLLQNKDVNGLYYKDGHLSKVEYPLSDAMISNAANKFAFLYNTYLKDTDTKNYLCAVPDKNYYLLQDGSHLALNYDKLFNDLYNLTPFLQNVDIRELLTLDNYFFTDTHWKQETIIPVAQALANTMGVQLDTDYKAITSDYPFYGVYCGQLPIGTEPDKLTYLTSDELKGCTVTYFNGKDSQIGEMYNLFKLSGKDAYEAFLSGTQPLITIENPSVKNGRELVVFRDSFGSSLIPLLAGSYQKITVVDIRYMRSDMVGQFVSFDDQDVLFLYSTLVLNASSALN